MGTPNQDPSVGGMLAGWRRARRMSQLDLAGETGVSARHLSFVESGRLRPSRPMVLRLADALGLPPRVQNELLLAGGFAPVHRETALDAPEMAEMVAALRMLLARHDPLPAVAFDTRWDIVMANRAYAAAIRAAAGPAAFAGAPPPEPLAVCGRPRANILRLLCHPDGLSHALDNWPEAVAAILARVRLEVARDGDPARRRLLAEMLAYPGVRLPDPGAAPAVPALIVPVALRTPTGVVRYFSTVATLGTAQDITLQELRIETFHLAEGDPAGPG